MALATTTTLLPHDSILEILSWMPMKPLARLKCVSKPWLNLIESPDFIELQHERLNELLLVFVDNNSLELKSLELNNTILDDDDHPHPLLTEHRLKICQLKINPKIVIVGSSNGLLCIVVYAERVKHKFELVLYNPITRTQKLLPPSDFSLANYTTFGFGYDSMSDDYKVVLIIQSTALYGKTGRNNDGTRVSVYRLKDDRWVESLHECRPKPFTNINFVGRPSCWEYNSISNFVNNAFHWPEVRRNNYERSIIACFGLSTEQFYEISLPRFERYCMVELHVLRGRLHLLVANVDLWVMKEYGVEDSWTKLYSLPSKEGVVRPITYWKVGSEMLFEKEAKEDRGRRKVFSFVLKNQIVKDLKVSLHCYNIGYYENTLAK